MEMSIQKSIEKPRLGLKDLGHNILRCSMCDSKLMDIFKTGENKDLEWTVKASCPYCEERGLTEYSYPFKFTGIFYPGGYGEGEKDKTRFKEVREENGVQVFMMEKVK